MMNGKEYIESLRKLKPKVYFMGRKIDSVADDPITAPHVNAAAMTYELANDPRYEDVMTATSHLTGEKINRFTHIHQSTEDLVKKVRMMRLLGRKTGSCFQRCVGLDALCALYITTYDVDRKYGTDYHERFKDYLIHVQKNDLMAAGAMTDVKGDRSLRPHQQADPDVYVRVVERREDGIVVRGAKAHITGAVNSHEIIALPTRAMGEEDKDYAVAFAVPVDAEGVVMIFGRQTNDVRRLDGDIDCGNAKYATVGGEALIIFNDVFVPWERVFMCGEYDFASELVETFATYHRQNYGGCKVGVADVLIGASAAIAEYNGVERASHIVDKLTEMVHLAETCWCCSLACSYEGFKTPSGAYMPNLLLANVTKLNITRFPYEWSRLAQDIVGGLVATTPSELDYKNPETRDLIEKYLKGKADVPTEHRVRMIRLIENLSIGAELPESMHGAGSPAAQKIMIARRANIDVKKEEAKRVAGILPDEDYLRVRGFKREGDEGRS
ncbi:4-hydroxyphenylacetate 3-hydroxylase family protein [Archaeoglobus fulgidus]|jgi:4-hydroxybutyryl-CoA dehydratase/vinylacetyl-CoA-Delta-isomerase|nr:4-hydroxyphenylacetate 3-hydroxylase family protein [Archaeoglobus fulgidus]AIG97154.1 Aromatic ring hydroxylase [Archaeoglobus fulgidus DSM 8774]